MAADERKRQWRIVGFLAGVVVLVLGVMGVTTLLPNLNPFSSKDVDRSQPVLLQSIKDLAQFHAAVGEFQVVIDLEKDVNWVPSFLAGERALFVAAGTVNAYVDFSQLKNDALKVSPDRKSVEIRLPPAQLDKPNLDQKRSYLFAQQRGIWDRLTSLFEVPDQQQFYTAGEQKIAEAAKSAGLLERADKNTRAMLIGMIQPLGYQVTFASDTAS
ncbi:DUF4230 domain-containing protein [Actinophytocola sp.]|uniref:DUF4230 domain-containing protein n=1 Tax=Actinophytocola sp. TaxID=1872138 RepID=UPI002D7E982D|nr:DUF4230 domain-containing protein [Actinophytocola sp.]HET9142828.1 DUF4230 domain-containing protein [Actinophytocola sp.]